MALIDTPSPEITPTSPVTNPPVTKAGSPTPGFLQKKLTPLQSIIALVIIFLVAVGLVGYAFFVKQQAEPLPTSLPLSQTTQPLTLALTSPNDGAIVENDEITVSGVTLPNTTVMLYTDTADNSVESNPQGRFEGTIKLTGGINTLTVTAFGDNDEQKSLALDLVYDDQVKAAQTDKLSPGQVKKALANLGEAVVGVIETVNNNSLTIRGKGNNRITETVVDVMTKIVGQDKKALKLNSLKPKDTAAIIATESGNATDGGQLRKALKIFIKEASLSAQTKRQAIQGIISDISGNQITLVHQTQRDRTYTLLTNNQTIVAMKDIAAPTLANLQVGLRIAAVGDLDTNNNLVAKRIHVIPGKAVGIFQKQPLPSPSPAISPTSPATPSSTPTASPSASPSPTP